MTNPTPVQLSDERLSDERLAEMLSLIPRYADGSVRSRAWVARVPAPDIFSILTELQHSRAEEAVAWRPVSEPPVAMSVLARFFDGELGEWVYTVVDPGPLKLSMAAPYSEWLPLSVFNRPLSASPASPSATGVRALEWSEPNSVGVSRAETGFGLYIAKPSGNGRWNSEGKYDDEYIWWLDKLHRDDNHAATLSAAKAAAQAHFDAAILSAIVGQP